MVELPIKQYLKGQLAIASLIVSQVNPVGLFLRRAEKERVLHVSAVIVDNDGKLRFVIGLSDGERVADIERLGRNGIGLFQLNFCHLPILDERHVDRNLLVVTG